MADPAQSLFDFLRIGIRKRVEIADGAHELLPMSGLLIFDTRLAAEEVLHCSTV